MSDPKRLLDLADSLEARLLSSALDEAPPPDLLARTLAAVGAAPPPTPGNDGGPGQAPASPAAPAAAAKAVGGGLLSAVGIGVLAAVLTVGAFALSTRRPEPRAPTLAAPPATVANPPAPPPPPADPQTAPERPPAPDATADRSPPPVVRTGAPERPAPRAAGSASSSPRPPPLAVEIALLDEARSALHEGDPARAKAVLDRYAREVPHGQMAREAALLRAEAAAATAGTNP